MNLFILIPQPEILPIHSLSSARNSEQVIFLSKSATKKTSRKKKVSQNEELSSSNIDKTNSGVKLSKGEDGSESKTINHSILSIPGSDVQARIENLQEYKKQLQAKSLNHGACYLFSSSLYSPLPSLLSSESKDAYWDWEGIRGENGGPLGCLTGLTVCEAGACAF
ncbi:5830_t:CDS:2 [Cetraspora pellucida]|uniref:5830_t:CDS:1 n=1 Tax=Cetraspora pellucida TaxID=1433469 RepID=A0A9N8YR84_9GLOM|nr:5830_t:CDS:2 [Cetraspora pellucida]